MITIEWASSFNRDGTRKRPPPSTIHGWLAKWRGTFLGNERLRSMGMREMREARAVRRYKKAKKQQINAAQGSGSRFALFTFGKRKPVRYLRHSARSQNKLNDPGAAAKVRGVGKTTPAPNPAKTSVRKPPQVHHKHSSRARVSRFQHQTPRRRGH